MECKICGQSIDETDASSYVKLRKIGASGVNAASKAQKDNLIEI